MAEADRSILHRAVITEARRRSIKAVKRRYQAQGLKVHHFSLREIVAAANDYLRDHPELIAEAAEVVERWRAEGFFGRRLAAAQAIQNLLGQRAKISNEIMERS